jgi:nitrogen regulatory protein P-II 1
MKYEMKEIKAIIQPHMLDQVLAALRDYRGLPGVTVSEVLGWGKSRAESASGTVREGGFAFAKKTKLEIVVADEIVEPIVDLITRAARTGRPGDGKIFIIDVNDSVKIRTGDRGVTAV